eukprot:1381098-Rhodomonas_salina.2
MLRVPHLHLRLHPHLHLPRHLHVDAVLIIILFIFILTLTPWRVAGAGGAGAEAGAAKPPRRSLSPHRHSPGHRTPLSSSSGSFFPTYSRRVCCYDISGTGVAYAHTPSLVLAWRMRIRHQRS